MTDQSAPPGDSPRESTEMPPEMPLEIGVLELRDLLRSAPPPLVLDVREPWEREICALPGSLAIPMGQIPDRLGEVPGDVPLVVLCHHGQRSWHVTNWLRSQGFSLASNLNGGIDAWARAVDPAVAVY